MIVPAVASADDQPAILKSYGLDWIERVRDEAWPQPKEKRPVICLLDTGVAITPDTPADNLLGPIVARLSVEDPMPGSVQPLASLPVPSGVPQGESFDHLHGTRMAAIIAAPRNGSGTVGVFPQARIVSVRVTRGTQVYIAPDDMLRGVRLCRYWALAASVGVASVVMAESRYDQRELDVPRWVSAAELTATSGGVLVAAMGNRPDAQLVAPLAVKRIVAVGAGADNGGLCPDTPPSPNQVVGPGCSTSSPGWYPGSSSATAATGALIAALGTRQPAASAEALRGMLDASVRSDGSGRRILAGDLARTLFPGLIQDPVIEPTLTPELVVAPEAGQRGPSAEVPVRLWRPGARAVWRRGRLAVVRTTHRGRGVLRVQVSSRTTPQRIKTRRGSFKVSRRPPTVDVWAESADGVTWRSLTRRVRVSS